MVWISIGRGILDLEEHCLKRRIFMYISNARTIFQLQEKESENIEKFNWKKQERWIWLCRMYIVICKFWVNSYMWFEGEEDACFIAWPPNVGSVCFKCFWIWRSYHYVQHNYGADSNIRWDESEKSKVLHAPFSIIETNEKL